MDKIGTVAPGFVPALPVVQIPEQSVEDFRKDTCWWEISKLHRAKLHHEADALTHRYSLMGWI